LKIVQGSRITCQVSDRPSSGGRGTPISNSAGLVQVRALSWADRNVHWKLSTSLSTRIYQQVSFWIRSRTVDQRPKAAELEMSEGVRVVLPSGVEVEESPTVDQKFGPSLDETGPSPTAVLQVMPSTSTLIASMLAPTTRPQSHTVLWSRGRRFGSSKNFGSSSTTRGRRWQVNFLDSLSPKLLSSERGSTRGTAH